MSSPLESLKKTKKPPMMALSEMNSGRSIIGGGGEQNHREHLPFTPSSMPSTRLSPLPLYNTSHRHSPISPYNLTSFNTASQSKPLSTNLNLNLDNETSRAPYKSKIDDSDLIDQMTTKMAVNNMKRNMTKNNPETDRTPTDMDLMQIMMQKIKRTEARCAIFEKESYEKDRRIKVLEEKLHLYKKSANNDSSTVKDELIKDMQLKNLKLQKQILEMKNFLADYGLVWVGNKDKTSISSDDDQSETEQALDEAISTDAVTSTDSRHQTLFECNYDLIVKHVNELNALIESENHQHKIVQYGEKSVKFESNDEKLKIRLVLYSNGIFLLNGPFRSFDDSLTRKFCIDLMDGYFPSELQSRYPDGVFFDLVDKRDIVFEDKHDALIKNSNRGYRLGSGRLYRPDDSDKYEILSQGVDKETNVESQLLENPMSIEEFLNKLPSKVVKNSQLVDVRSDISKLLKDDVIQKSDEPEIVVNDQNKESQQDSSYTQAEQTTTLRIKSINPNDQTVYLFKMKYTDKLSDLKSLIRTQRRNKGILQDFDLASVYPRKTFDNLKLSLEECQLVPNSNVLLIPKKR